MKPIVVLICAAAALTAGCTTTHHNRSADELAAGGNTRSNRKITAADLQDTKERAHAQAVKELYAAIQHTQDTGKPDTKTPPAQTETATLPIVAPARVVNGVILDPSIEYIRIVQ